MIDLHTQSPDVLRVLRTVFAVSESGLGADREEVRDLLVMDGMTFAQAEAAIVAAEAARVVYFGTTN